MLQYLPGEIKAQGALFGVIVKCLLTVKQLPSIMTSVVGCITKQGIFYSILLHSILLYYIFWMLNIQTIWYST